MNKRPHESSAHLQLIERAASTRSKSVVLRVTIFKRKGSKFYQASVSIAGERKRITTRSVSRQSASEFAELAYRHFSRMSQLGKSKTQLTSNKELIES